MFYEVLYILRSKYKMHLGDRMLTIDPSRNSFFTQQLTLISLSFYSSNYG